MLRTLARHDQQLSPTDPPSDRRDPELLRQVILALALANDEIGAAEAVDLADRAVGLVRARPELDPPAALEAARRDAG